MATLTPKDEHPQRSLWPEPRAWRNRVLFSHQTDEWETPHALFRMLDREFHFTLDVCATATNTKCAQYLTKQDNGLLADWGTNHCWMNPPYSQLLAWLTRAHDASLRGATVVCLTFARTDTAGFHDAVAHASEIRFLRGRLRFGTAKHCAPAPSCLIIFRPTNNRTPPPVQLTFGFAASPTGPTIATISRVTP